MKTILDFPATIAKMLIRIYQKLFSFDHSFWARPDVFRVCIHYPSCSEYTYQAIDRFGLLRGGWLGFLRILRCHPFTKDRFDEVPKVWGEKRKRHES